MMSSQHLSYINIFVYAAFGRIEPPAMDQMSMNEHM